MTPNDLGVDPNQVTLTSIWLVIIINLFSSFTDLTIDIREANILSLCRKFDLNLGQDDL